MAPSNTEKYLDYLDQKAPIAPANSQEELQAAEAIADVFEAHGLEAKVEEFVASGVAPTVRSVLRVIVFIGILLAHATNLPLTILGVALTLFSAVVLALDTMGHTILTHNTPPVRSQNVVAVHRATGSLVSKGKRPIVIVAHYDTKRTNPMRSRSLVGLLPILSVAAFYGLWIAILCAATQLIFALGTARLVLWITGIVALLPSVALGIAGITEKFGAYSEGANDNKASVAAMFSVLNTVRPNKNDLDGLYIPQTQDSSEEAFEDISSYRPAYTPADKNQAAARAAAPAPARPTYHLETIKGVRHGKDLLEQLGVLPPECEIEYIRPQMVSDEPAAAAPVEPLTAPVEAAHETDPAAVVEPAYEATPVVEPVAAVDVAPIANVTTSPEAYAGIPEESHLDQAEVQPLAEFEPASDDQSAATTTNTVNADITAVIKPIAPATSDLEQDESVESDSGEQSVELPEAVATPMPVDEAVLLTQDDTLPVAEVQTQEPETLAEDDQDEALVAEVEPLPIENLETAGVEPINTEADLSAELPVISPVEGAVTHSKVTRPENNGFISKFKSILGIKPNPSVAEQVARMVPAENDLGDEVDSWLMGEAFKSEPTPTKSEKPAQGESAAITKPLNIPRIDAVTEDSAHQEDVTASEKSDSEDTSISDEACDQDNQEQAEQYAAQESPEVTAQFMRITDDMLPEIDLISPETSDQFDTVPEAAFANLNQEKDNESVFAPEPEDAEWEVQEVTTLTEDEDSFTNVNDEEPVAPVASFEQLETETPTTEPELEAATEEASEEPAADDTVVDSEVDVQDAFFEPVPNWMKTLMQEGSNTAEQPTENSDVMSALEEQQLDEQLDDVHQSAVLPNADFEPITNEEQEVDFEEESEFIEASDVEMVEPVEELTEDSVEETEEEELLPEAAFEILAPAEPEVVENTHVPVVRKMPNSYDGETDEGAMYITSEFPLVTAEQIEQEIEASRETESSSDEEITSTDQQTPEITAQFRVIDGALSRKASDSTPRPSNTNADVPPATFEVVDTDHTGVANFKGDGDESGLHSMGTEDPDATSADPVRQVPQMPNDPTWGSSSFEPSQANVARRAALFDLPDPTTKEVDPFSESDPDVTAPTPRTQMAQLPSIEGEEKQENQPKHHAARKSKKYVPTKRLDDPSSKKNGTGDSADRKRKRHMFGKRSKQEESSLSQWLGVEDDFDARRDGQEIGSWDNFDDTPKWKGGAAVNEPYRIQDIHLSGDAVDPRDLRDAIVGMGDEELLSHDIWFVALGASDLDHAGTEAFLEEHRKSIRGAFVINLDSIGAGDLTLLSQEGLYRKRRADRRLVRLLMGIAHDLNIALPTKRYTWAETDVTQAMRSSLRSVTLMGTNASATPSQSGTKEDVYDSVNHQQVQDVVRLVCELIRRS